MAFLKYKIAFGKEGVVPGGEVNLGRECEQNVSEFKLRSLNKVSLPKRVVGRSGTTKNKWEKTVLLHRQHRAGVNF